MAINFLKPTNTQTTWKTIRGFVAKNLIALMLTGHPLGLVENMIHTPIDRIVNKKLCTDNKLLNVGLHVATCLSVDSLIHGSGHEIAEAISGNHVGHVHGEVGGVQQAGVSDVPISYDSTDIYNPDIYPTYETYTSDYDINIDSGDADISESTIVEEKKISPMMQAKMQAMKIMDATGLDQYDPTTGQDFTKLYEQADAEGLIDHTGHDHGSHGDHTGHEYDDHDVHGHEDHPGHDHGDHGGHGVLPILGGAIIEEYGPTMYKVTKKRTQGLLSRMFNYDTGSDTKIVNKSDLSTLGNNAVNTKTNMKSKGRVIDFEPNIVADTKNKTKVIPLGNSQKQMNKAA